MLYTGETLQEVFSKAIGKPIGGYGKQDADNPHATLAAIAGARRKMVRVARMLIADASVRIGANEVGYRHHV